MVEVIEDGFPPGVVALRAFGKVDYRDYEDVVIPSIERAVAAHGKIRFFYHVAEDFTEYTSGALWDDAKVGLRHFTAFEKAAVVTDVRWIRNSVKFFRFMIPCPVKVFANSEFDEAVVWIKA